MSRKARTILIVVLSLVVGIPVIAIVGLMALLGQFRDNVAQDAAHPIVSAMSGLGGSILCDVGDAGYGPDNTQPWYQGQVDVPDSPKLIGAVTAAAATEGYTLVNAPDKAGASEFVAGKTLGRSIEIRVFRGKHATAECNDGRSIKAKPGHVVVEIDVAYPYRDL
jgi:hypothetical protein